MSDEPTGGRAAASAPSDEASPVQRTHGIRTAGAEPAEAAEDDSAADDDVEVLDDEPVDEPT